MPSLDKVFFFIDFFSLDMCNNIQVGVEFSSLGNLKNSRWLPQNGSDGRKHDTSYFGLLVYGVFKFYVKNMFRS